MHLKLHVLIIFTDYVNISIISTSCFNTDANYEMTFCSKYNCGIEKSIEWQKRRINTSKCINVCKRMSEKSISSWLLGRLSSANWAIEIYLYFSTCLLVRTGRFPTQNYRSRLPALCFCGNIYNDKCPHVAI